MKNFIVDIFVKFSDMTETERILYLIPLAVKEKKWHIGFYRNDGNGNDTDYQRDER